jgi:DNA uptake protein ComE-like DNA-binding protein
MRFTAILTFFSLLFLTSVSFAQVGKSDILNPNMASENELAGLPGMTSELVDAIVSTRPFATNLELDATLGDALTDDQKAALRAELFLPMDLNSASREELQLMPGMTNRWMREFNEYRPYEDLAEFRREMSKYTDSEGVAELEQYVFVPMDLNSASDEDFMTIPGMTSRWLREFNEYAPYEDMAEFHREMGKYADEDEVGRLARYVYVGM